jgi:hypothetical protein
LEGDGVAAFELGDGASGGAGGVAAGLVVAVGVEVGQAGCRHVPDGEERRVGDRESGLVGAAAGADWLVLGVKGANSRVAVRRRFGSTRG